MPTINLPKTAFIASNLNRSENDLTVDVRLAQLMVDLRVLLRSEYNRGKVFGAMRMMRAVGYQGRTKTPVNSKPSCR